MMNIASSIGRLRYIAKEELSLMLSWRNAPSVRSNMYSRHKISMDEHLLWWERTKKNSTQQYFMYDRSDMPLGIVAFTSIDVESKNSCWAFYASPEAPRGTGSRMELLALEYAFKDLNLHKLYCEVLGFNLSVIKLHQKFGFKLEGVLREQHLYIDQYVDINRLALMASEWGLIRGGMIAKITRLSEH